MEITKKEGYYLFTNKEGEYHISYEKYDLIGKEEAIKLLKKGADVSNFGDPVEWQKKDRTERKINGL